MFLGVNSLDRKYKFAGSSPTQGAKPTRLAIEWL